MKKAIAFIILVLIAVTAVITCPTKEMHKDALQTTIKNVLNNDLNYSDTKTNNQELVNGILSFLGSSVVGFTLDEYLTVDNYFIFSIGKLGWTQDKQAAVSIGVFNHVFTISEEDIEKKMEK